MLAFDPYSIIGQYGMDLAGYLLYRQKPRRIYIQTTDLEIAKAVSRRFLGSLDEILVDGNLLAQAIRDAYRLQSSIYDQTEVDAAIVPFSRKNCVVPPPANFIVVIAENSLSYRTLLHPGRVPDNLFAVRKWLMQTHQIRGLWGLLDPIFIGRQAISQLAGYRNPVLHFGMAQSALDSIYVTGPRAWTSYIVLLSGSRINQ